MIPELRIVEELDRELFFIEGELTTENAVDFESRLSALHVDAGSAITLDMTALDIEDGVALTTAINAIRGLRAGGARIVLKGAPQMLGHNLYRIGLLEGRNPIELVDLRADEPYV